MKIIKCHNAYPSPCCTHGWIGEWDDVKKNKILEETSLDRIERENSIPLTQWVDRHSRLIVASVWTGLQEQRATWIPLDASAIETSPPFLNPSLNQPNPPFSQYERRYHPLEVFEIRFRSRSSILRTRLYIIHIFYYI